jgi:hypothetical protein
MQDQTGTLLLTPQVGQQKEKIATLNNLQYNIDFFSSGDSEEKYCERLKSIHYMSTSIIQKEQ